MRPTLASAMYRLTAEAATVERLGSEPSSSTCTSAGSPRSREREKPHGTTMAAVASPASRACCACSGLVASELLIKVPSANRRRRCSRLSDV